MGSCEICLVWRLHATNGMGWTMGTASYQKIGWGASSGVDIWNVDTSEHFAFLSPVCQRFNIDWGGTRSWWVFERCQLGVGRIWVELAFWQELVLMFAPTGNMCSLAFGATVSFLPPFVRPSTHSLIKFCTCFETGMFPHMWLPLLRAGNINAYAHSHMISQLVTSARHPYNFFQHVRRSARRVALWDLKGPEAKQRPGSTDRLTVALEIFQVWSVLCYRSCFLFCSFNWEDDCQCSSRHLHVSIE